MNQLDGEFTAMTWKEKNFFSSNGEKDIVTEILDDKVKQI